MSPDFEKARRYVFARLAQELSPHLAYHSLAHTKDDVLPAAARLGRFAGLEKEDYLLLETAALYHDTGFLVSYHDHERYSIQIARATLPDFGYSAEQIESIAGLIAATRMPQRPTGLLQELMCDADLDLLGRDDFMQLNRNLLQEISHFNGRTIPEKDWLTAQTSFLVNHNFFTSTARMLRADGKARNIALMQAALLSSNGSGYPADLPA